MKPPKVQAGTVFLNVPYDRRFSDLFLAYTAGLAHLSLQPRATLEIPGGERRLDRILMLIQSCRYSIHDLSRVELERTAPPTPRFNMPFELGMTVTWQKMNRRRHTWFVFESQPRRIDKSLSDLKGTDAYIHNGTAEGVMRELCNAFIRSKSKPEVPQMLHTYQLLRRDVRTMLRRAGTDDLFQARLFEDIYYAASLIASQNT